MGPTGPSQGVAAAFPLINNVPFFREMAWVSWPTCAQPQRCRKTHLWNLTEAHHMNKQGIPAPGLLKL